MAKWVFASIMVAFGVYLLYECAIPKKYFFLRGMTKPLPGWIGRIYTGVLGVLVLIGALAIIFLDTN